MRDRPLYDRPGLYDLEYEDKTNDIGYYVSRALAADGPVLELGCGTGRILLAVARAEVEVHGVDSSLPMLEALRRTLSSEPAGVRQSVRLWKGNFCDLQTTIQYSAIFLPFNALHHCTHHRDLLALLEGVRRSLRPNGRFYLDCYLPDPRLYQGSRAERIEERVFTDPDTGETLQSWERSWYETLAQRHCVVYVYRRPSGEEFELNVRFRMYYPQEIRAIIDWAGFDILKESSDFRGTALDNDAAKLVLELVPRTSTTEG